MKLEELEEDSSFVTEDGNANMGKDPIIAGPKGPHQQIIRRALEIFKHPHNFNRDADFIMDRTWLLILKRSMNPIINCIFKGQNRPNRLSCTLVQHIIKLKKGITCAPKYVLTKKTSRFWVKVN